MEIHAEHAIRPGGGDQVRDEFRGDRYAAFILAILSGVTQIRDHRGDSFRGGSTQAVDVDQQFDEVVVHRLAGRLDHEAVAASDVLVQLYENFAVGKHRGGALAHRQFEMLAHRRREFVTGTSGEDLQVFAITCGHELFSAGVRSCRVRMIPSTRAICSGSLMLRTSPAGTASTTATVAWSSRVRPKTSVM